MDTQAGGSERHSASWVDPCSRPLVSDGRSTRRGRKLRRKPAIGVRVESGTNQQATRNLGGKAVFDGGLFVFEGPWYDDWMTKPDPSDKERLTTSEEDDASTSSQRQALAGVTKRWSEAHKQRISEASAALAADSPGATSGERMLLQLAATASLTAELIDDAALQLSERLKCVMDDPRLALHIAKLLREVVSLQGSASRRTGELLLAAATLRGQRNLLEIKEKKGWHEGNVGVYFTSPGSDTHHRPAASRRH